MRLSAVLALALCLYVSSAAAWLEWQLLYGTSEIDAPARTGANATPGGVALGCGAQSGDAVFVFGGSTDKGRRYTNQLYGWGTGVNGTTAWKALTPAGVADKGSYGALGNFSAHFYPSARAGACMQFMTTSHVFLFGGRGLDSTGSEGYLNDLWSVEDFAQWGWLAGSKLKNRPQVIGGVDATPSARWKHSCGTHYQNKEFYVFGGEGEHPSDPNRTALLDDLFVFSASGWERFFGSNAHSQPPQYSGPGANPGGRSEHSSVVFEDGFFVFGGLGVAVDPVSGAASNVHLSDLWMFHLRERRWIYLSGSPTPNAYGSYPPAIGMGGKGMGYGPGARVQAAMAFNELTSDLYIFGGFGSDYNSQWGYLNPNRKDLWKYNIKYEVWTWMGGSSSIATPGAPLGQGISARSGALMFAGTDGLQFTLTVFGGVGLASGKEPGALSDVWEIHTQLPKDVTIAAPSTTRTTVSATTEAPTLATPAATTEHEDATEKTDATEAAATSKPTTVTEATKAVDETKATAAAATPAPTTQQVKPTRPPTPAPTHPPLFDATSPQKIAALVMGSFIAIVLMVGGIIFLGFAMTSSAPQGSRVVAEPYLAV